MNENNNEPADNPQTTAPPELPNAAEKPIYEAMEETPTFGGVIDALLKAPGCLLYEWQEGRTAPVVRVLALVFAGSFLTFGFLMGLFSGGNQLWIVPLKVLAGALISAAITLPSLYVFSSLGGFDMSLRKAAGLLLTGITLVGVILIGLAPVLWIFTQSTDSVGFMGFLVLLFWVSALWFGLGMIVKNAKAFGDHSTGFLALWALIFVVVTLQMSTSLRPLLGAEASTLLPTEKRFFLEHWIGEFGD